MIKKAIEKQKIKFFFKRFKSEPETEKSLKSKKIFKQPNTSDNILTVQSTTPNQDVWKKEKTKLNKS